MIDGWVKMKRLIRQTKIYKDARAYKVLSEIMLSVQIKDTIVNNIQVKKGELLFSYRSFVERFKDDRVKISKRQLEVIIKNLVKGGFIELKSNGRGRPSVIRLLNKWEDALKQGIDAGKTVTLTPENCDTSTESCDTSNESCDTHDTKSVTQQNTPSSCIESIFSDDYFNGVTHESEKCANSIQNGDTSLESCDTHGAKGGLIIRKNKESKERKKKEEEGLYTIIDNVMSYLNSIKKQDITKDDPFLIRSFAKLYTQGYKKSEDYILIADYKHHTWKGQTHKDGKDMMSYFRPQTLFFKNMTKYLHEAKTFENNLSQEAKSDTGIYTMDDFYRKEKELQEYEAMQKKKQEEEIKRKNKEKFEKNLKDKENLQNEGKLVYFQDLR